MSQTWKCVGGPMHGQTVTFDGYQLVAAEVSYRDSLSSARPHDRDSVWYPTTNTVRYEAVREIQTINLKTHRRDVVVEAELVR